MSRSGYSDDGDHIDLYRQAVARATNGERGQRLLRDLLTALDAMPDRRLIPGHLEHDRGVCALGALGKARGLDMANVDPHDPHEVAETFDIAPSLAREIVFANDEAYYGNETPERRWLRVRRWVASQIEEGAR